VIDTMVLTDSSFDENRKRCDPSMNLEFFEFQQQLFDFEFLSMNDDCLKIKVTFDFTCKEVG